eukprot:Nk52_evm5s378 gene=Nk52_evmTU5s378
MQLRVEAKSQEQHPLAFLETLPLGIGSVVNALVRLHFFDVLALFLEYAVEVEIFYRFVSSVTAEQGTEGFSRGEILFFVLLFKIFSLPYFVLTYLGLQFGIINSHWSLAAVLCVFLALSVSKKRVYFLILLVYVAIYFEWVKNPFFETDVDMLNRFHSLFRTGTYSFVLDVIANNILFFLEYSPLQGVLLLLACVEIDIGWGEKFVLKRKKEKKKEKSSVEVCLSSDPDNDSETVSPETVDSKAVCPDAAQEKVMEYKFLFSTKIPGWQFFILAELTAYLLLHESFYVTAAYAIVLVILNVQKELSSSRKTYWLFERKDNVQVYKHEVLLLRVLFTLAVVMGKYLALV